jgi:branched-chain amino acid transport system substrate-binding protein
VTRRRLVSGTVLFTTFALAASLLLAGACGEPKPVTIGALVPDTGPAKTYGRSVRHGIEFAVEEINAAGGVGGRKQLIVEFRDTQTEPEAAARAFDELAALDVPAVIGPGASNVALELVDDAAEREVVLISPSASTPRLTQEGGQWFFRVYPSDVVEGARMADFCRQQAWSKIGIVATNNAHGQDIAEIFTNRFEAGVREVVFREDVETIGEEQISRVLSQIRKTQPNALYVATFQDEFATLLEGLEELEQRPVVLGTSAITDKVIKMAGDAAEGVVFPQLFCGRCTDDPEILEFVDNFKKKYGEDPDTYAAHAYDAVRVLVQAMEAVPVINADQLLGQLTRLEYQGVTGKINFNVATHDVVKTPSVFAIADGKVMRFDKFRQTPVGERLFPR